MKLRNALLAATIMAVPVALRAQPVDGLYIGAGAGANLLQNETVRRITNGPSNFGRGSDYRFDVGPVVVGEVGYGLAGLFPAPRSAACASNCRASVTRTRSTA